MRFHVVSLLSNIVKVDGIDALVASGAGFLVLVWMLRGALLGVFFKDFTLFQRVPVSMQHACTFCTGHHIIWMACIVSLALSSIALIRFGRRGGCSSLLITYRTGMGRFCPLGIFGTLSSFLYCLRDLHVLKHFPVSL